MKSLIKSLVETPGPSGSEQTICEKIRSEVASYVDELRVDALGNLIACKGEKKAEGLRLMLSAHMDEIGVMVTYVDENGFLRFITIGGVSPRTCLGGRVLFLNGVQGVIGCEKLEDNNNQPAIDQFFIDVGAHNRQDCKVKIGDVAGFERSFLDLGNRLVAKSMDNRISVAILVEMLRQLEHTPHQIYAVFSTQEEVGLRGAIPAAYGIDPDLGLAVDVTAVGDTPKGIKMEVGLGNGPAIKVRDSSFISDPRLVRWMVAVAEKEGIPYQLEVLERGGTDGQSIQLARAGVPTAGLSIPCRYIHSPSEMVDYNDVQGAVRLLLALVSEPIVLE
jgi:putative aminopeptidase FrvX